MDFFQLKPTIENIYNTFVENSFDRNKSVINFVKALNRIDTNCTISIDGNWGSGKTFFVKQAKMLLDLYNGFLPDSYNVKVSTIENMIIHYTKENSFQINHQIAVYYDAWENDDESPVESLIYEICKADIGDKRNLKKHDPLNIASEIVKLCSNKDFSKLIESLKGKSVVDETIKSKTIKYKINEFFNALLPERGNRLVIFIDELDRCKPSFAIDLLEKIKHYFDNDKITFVFSINSAQLQYIIKKYYGNDFDGYKYLSKFFDINYTLPKIDKDVIFNRLNFNDDYTYELIVKIVAEKYDFEIRDINKYVLLLKIATANMDFYNMNINIGKNFSYAFILPILIGLKIYDIDLYNNFVLGYVPEPLVDVFTKLSKYSDFIDYLLETNESYIDYNVENCKIVSETEKITELYETLFTGKYYDNSLFRHKIGNVLFFKSDKIDLLESVSLISDFADFPKEDDD